MKDAGRGGGHWVIFWVVVAVLGWAAFGVLGWLVVSLWL